MQSPVQTVTAPRHTVGDFYRSYALIEAMGDMTEVQRTVARAITFVHGSGVNCEWDVVVFKNGNVNLTNYFHCMCEHGYYDGYAGFAVKVTPTGEYSLTMESATHNLATKYDLRPYLEDVFGHAADTALASARS